MDYKIIPFIVIICYIIGELYKKILKNIHNSNAYLPIIVSIVGGLISIVLYYTNQELFDSNNIFDCMIVGIMSGLSSTGTNQIIKQIKNITQ